MAESILIRGGTVVDGTGAPGKTADVLIEDGIVAEVGRVDKAGARRIDADGLLVLPTLRADSDEKAENVARLIRKLKAEKESDRMQAASDLARLGADARPALKALVEVMQKDRVAKVRAYAVLAIKNMGEEGKPALEKVIEVLKKDRDNLVRCVACDTLARLATPAAA